MNAPNLNPFLDGFAGGLHFIGAGGAGMAALARVAAGKGLRVTGSDLFPSPGLRELEALGAEIRIGHGERLPEGTAAAVYSGAVSPDNPELRAAQAAGVPVLHRSRLLADLFDVKRGLAVAGSHGKTSTAALLSLIARAGGEDSAFAVGGTLIGPEANGLWGEGPFLVAEADESDASFLAYRPEGIVLTGIELDHVNRYPDLESLRRVFAAFFSRIRPGGFLVHPGGEPPPLDGLAPGVRVRSFGLGPEADYRVVEAVPRGWSTRFGLIAAGRELSGLSSRTIGTIGLLNAAAAAAAAFEAGFGPDAVREGLASYRGVRRRLELKARTGDITVVEDYAHHPTEVAGAIRAVRERTKKRLIAAFEPHRYSRLRRFHRELARALTGADEIVVADLYPAFEPPLPGVDAGVLVRDLAELGRAAAGPVPVEELPGLLAGRLAPGDTALLMGAGTISAAADRLADRLRSLSPPAEP